MQKQMMPLDESNDAKDNKTELSQPQQSAKQKK